MLQFGAGLIYLFINTFIYLFIYLFIIKKNNFHKNIKQHNGFQHW